MLEQEATRHSRTDDVVESTELRACDAVTTGGRGHDFRRVGFLQVDRAARKGEAGAGLVDDLHDGNRELFLDLQPFAPVFRVGKGIDQEID